MTTPTTPPQIKEVIRLDSDTYGKLASQFGTPVVTDKTTEIQAGYQLGVQAVLAAIRHGFVIGGR